MARNFNRSLAGLLGYIDQKSDGRTPAYLHESTQAVLEVDPWLRGQAESWRIASYPVSNSVSAIDNLVPITPEDLTPSGGAIPPGEIWLIFDSIVQMTWSQAALTAGDRAHIGFKYRQDLSAVVSVNLCGNGYFAATAALPAVGANAYVVAHAFREAPVILFPGNCMAVTYDANFQNAGVSVRVSATGRVLRLPY